MSPGASIRCCAATRSLSEQSGKIKGQGGSASLVENDPPETFAIRSAMTHKVGSFRCRPHLGEAMRRAGTIERPTRRRWPRSASTAVSDAAFGFKAVPHRRTLPGVQSSRWGSRVKRLLFVLLVTAVLADPASAEKRVALVVGNSAYRSVARLDNPDNDAALMADAEGAGLRSRRGRCTDRSR